MGVKLNRNADSLFQGGDQLGGGIRSQQGRHILNTDGIRPGLLNALSVIHKVFRSEYRAGGIGNGNLGVSLFLLRGLNSRLQVFDIVQSVKNTDDIDTVGHRLLDEIFQDVVGIMAVAQHILASEQHLQLGIGAFLPNGAESVPRVLV